MTKPRILFVLANYYPYIGGAEKLFLRLAEGLVKKNYSVKVITSQLPGTAQFERVKGVEIERVNVPRFARQYSYSIFGFPAALREASKFDIIHTTSNYGALLAFFTAKLQHKPVVFTCNEILGNRWYRVKQSKLSANIYRIIERTIVGLPYDRFVAVSQATLNDYVQREGRPIKTAVIHNGVDEAFFSQEFSALGRLRTSCGLTDQDFLYVYFGRPGVTKGVENLIRAVNHITDRIPNSYLVLILSQEPSSQFLRLIQLIRDHPFKTHIKALPSFEDQKELIENLLDADCIVVPSITEGFGLTTAEACALNIPVIATRVGSIPEIISGRHILVEPLSEDSIASGVIRAWKGDFDWIPPKVFDWSRAVEEYEAIYEELIGCT